MPAAEPGSMVRFDPPPGWSRRVERHEGHPVEVFEPAGAGRAAAGQGSPPVTLRLVADRVAAGGGRAEPQVLIRELALRFVRPDDPRASDRVIEANRDGGIVAQAVMRTEEDGRREVHYLWFIGAPRGMAVATAMLSALVPEERDGEPATVALLQQVDAAIEAATLLG